MFDSENFTLHTGQALFNEEIVIIHSSQKTWPHLLKATAFLGRSRHMEHRSVAYLGSSLFVFEREFEDSASVSRST
ncbi:hypothetical protein AX774_g1832 [Zancudomyces culisetae]|uniref:Uncharacterized protein n=1 Tax=Zancudomyces culisetae TaxID=1213189 RepID=A0A1R1PUM7_ZANCU|nr:hypothetical protein AX774_g1832 [Zancudomyces culisetae]|eukprot:OMH84647.1 hypothetical protein AX774_g1832 [Zancudomyces culisetae]